MTKLSVGDRPYSAAEDSVRTLSGPHGTVESLALVDDRETGRPRGLGFIEMSAGEAARAMQVLNGHVSEGRLVKVNEAQAREPSAGQRRY